VNEGGANICLIMSLEEAENLLDQKLENLKCLNRRVEINLEKIQYLFEKPAFQKLRK
jgi:hypothetical protein